VSRNCVVVGAGPAGLSAAYRLANAGVHVIVLEGENEIGGRTRTERLEGFVVNTGANLLTSFFDVTLHLLRELRIEPFHPTKQPAIVATPFGKLPLEQGSTRALVRFPLIPWGAKLSAMWLSTRLALARRTHVADVATLAKADRGLTVEQWALRAAGEAVYDYLLRPALESAFFFGAAEASQALGKALVRHARKWEVLALPDGMGTLCDTLANRLDVRTGCWATAVDVGPSGVAVYHSGGTIEADYVILACPASATAKMEGPLPQQDRTDLATIRYAPNIVLVFGYERPITVQFPMVTPAGPGHHPVATMWTLSRCIPQYVPEEKDLVCIHASSWRSAELLDRDPARIAAALRADGEEVFGRLADPDWVRMYPRTEATVIPAPGHYRRMEAFLRRPRGRVLYAGDWLTGSTVEGAVRTGLRAAEQVLAEEK
jgi:protoporphyrinogen/coproporphyrinogen III oxidase